MAQETFLHFIRSVEQFRYRNLKGYLLTIARNVCMDYFRGCQRRQEKEESFRQKAQEDGAFAVSQQARSQQEEFLVTVEQLTEHLPQMQREAMVLYYGYGFKYREIARMTGVGIGTVKSRVRQGTRKLRKSMEEQGA